MVSPFENQQQPKNIKPLSLPDRVAYDTPSLCPKPFRSRVLEIPKGLDNVRRQVWGFASLDCGLGQGLEVLRSGIEALTFRAASVLLVSLFEVAGGIQGSSDGAAPAKQGLRTRTQGCLGFQASQVSICA